MKPYTFQLQTLLELRIHHRTEQQRRLAEALHAEEILAQQMADVQIELQQVKASASNRQVGDVDINRLLDAQRYELVLAGQLRLLSEKQKQVALESERRRQAVIEADRGVKSLQQLDEQHRATHRRQTERHLQRELDDLATTRFSRQPRDFDSASR
jgi:flagellar export protein FliJ